MRQLNDKEKSVLDNLVNTDAVANPKFGWDANFQRRLLGMLLTDRYFLIQSQSLVRPEYFSDTSHAMVARLLFQHFDHYKNLPERFIMEEYLNENIKERDAAIQLAYRSELDSLYDFFVPGFQSRDVLLDKLTAFAKVQAMKLAFHHCHELWRKAPEDEATWMKISDMLRTAMTVDRSFEKGLEYFPNIEELFERMKTAETGVEIFTSGFKSIDEAIAFGGPRRGEIYSWIGLPGVGKSLALVKAAVANVMAGKKVLYISLEMDELGIGQRFTSQFASYPINELANFQKEIVQFAKDFAKDYDDGNRLIIKQFPSGQLDVNGIRAYHSQLQLHGFRPDLVIVDYIGEMRDFPGIPTWESRYRILRDLRGFAIEEKFCCFTCVQPNKSAAELEIHQYIDESNIGTSFDQFKPLDGFWSINQLTQEKDAKVGRVFVIKHRNGKSRFPFWIEFDYKLLDIKEITQHKYRMRCNEQAALKSDEVGDKIDEIKPKFNPKGDEEILHDE
jgi:hypothetical protein